MPLEVTKSQTAEEFQRKVNGFITHHTRPKRIMSDNAVFKTTVTWIRKIRNSEVLQDFLAQQQITWQCSLSRLPWWGGLYERLIKEVKRTLYKTMGRTHLEYAQVEAVVMDIEQHLNNRLLMYMESHRIKRGESDYPEIGEIVLIINEEKNRGEWKKGRVLRHIRARDRVIRGVDLLHKGNEIQRPLQLVCPLEIRSRLVREGNAEELAETRVQGRTIERRRAAVDARAKIRLIAADD